MADGQLITHTKKCLEFENNAVGHMTFLSSRHVSQDPNKSLKLTNIVQCIGNMYNITNISIILYIFINIMS